MTQKKIPVDKLIVGTIMTLWVWGLIIAGIVTETEWLIGAGVIMLVGTVVLRLVGMARQTRAESTERRRIWREGSPAIARVESISQSGGLNNNPYVDIELRVSPREASAYNVATRALISKLAIPRIQPACMIPVRVDPKDPTNIVVDESLAPYAY